MNSLTWPEAVLLLGVLFFAYKVIKMLVLGE